MVITAKIKGFSNYYKTKQGWLIRLGYLTSHKHYKEARFISFNKRNQAVLYRDGKKEYWSKRQLNYALEKIEPFEIQDYCKVKETPF